MTDDHHLYLKIIGDKLSMIRESDDHCGCTARLSRGSSLSKGQPENEDELVGSYDKQRRRIRARDEVATPRETGFGKNPIANLRRVTGAGASRSMQHVVATPMIPPSMEQHRVIPLAAFASRRRAAARARAKKIILRYRLGLVSLIISSESALSRCLTMP